MAKKKKHSYPIEFRPPFVLRLLACILIVLLAIGFTSISYFAFDSIIRRSAPTAIALIISTVWTTFVLYTFLNALWWMIEYTFSMSIKVIPEGLLISYFSKRFYRWDSLLEFSKIHRPFGQGRALSIRTTQSKMRYRSKISRWIGSKQGYIQFIPLEHCVKIPTNFWGTPNIDKFKQTEFGQILYQHAPHLFEDSDDEKKKYSDDVYNQAYQEHKQMSQKRHG